MSELILVGAGHHGRGVLEIFRARDAARLETPHLAGFVDDDPQHHGRTIDGVPVLGDVDWAIAHRGANTRLILALSSPRAKRALAARLEPHGFEWATAVHPSVILGRETVVEAGGIVAAGTVIAYETRIGRHTTVNLGCTVGHHCTIGDYSTVGPGVNITGRVTLEDGVEVQTNATLVPGVRLGRECHVGAGSVVLENVPEQTSVFGNPARRLPRLLRQEP